MNKSKFLRILATITGAISYLYGAAALFFLIFDNNALNANIGAYLMVLAYPLGILCFWYVSENKNWKIIIPTAVFFPFVVAGLFLAFSALIDRLIEVGAKDALLFAIIPTIVVCSVLYRFINKKLGNTKSNE